MGRRVGPRAGVITCGRSALCEADCYVDFVTNDVLFESADDVVPKHDLTVVYRSVPVRSWENVRNGPGTKVGFCQRCSGEVMVETDSLVVSANATTRPGSRATIVCLCGGGHLGHPERENGCGAYWFDREAIQ